VNASLLNGQHKVNYLIIFVFLGNYSPGSVKAQKQAV